MSLSAGTRLGSYEILSALGAGGMGEVYRARDSRLDRDVAIKILPKAFTADAQRVARFQREAKILASLNHPHIAAIYGLEEAEDAKALVMELVDGEDLAQRLARGALTLDQALPIAKQIAEALEAAHEQGIIHRDLKPGNIRLRTDGTVKVLDFGLAKVLEPPSTPGSAMAASPTITTLGFTRTGVILGTAPYMSPEQARGSAVDKRTDIWAFGCVLYEMLTGRRAFAGATLTDTLSAIVERDPDWRALPDATPASVRRLLQRCLAKDPKRRLHDAADVRIEIDDALTVPVATAGLDTAASQRRARRGWFLVGLSHCGSRCRIDSDRDRTRAAMADRFTAGLPSSDVSPRFRERCALRPGRPDHCVLGSLGKPSDGFVLDADRQPRGHVYAAPER